jgi:hypothetical protein
MLKHLKYLSYVIRHKWFVLVAGLKLGLPLSQLLAHDWTKFLPDEWMPYTNYFYGNFLTRDEARTAFMLGMWVRTKEDCAGDFAFAWMKHQHRNKHHWQYWCKVDGVPLRETTVLIWDKGNAQKVIERGSASVWYELRDIDSTRITLDPMPEKYALEMLADWRGAGRAITGADNTLDWYSDNYHNIKLHPDTRLWVDRQLEVSEVPYAES